MVDTEKISKGYLKGQLMAVVATALVGLLVMRVWFLDQMLTPIVVSVVFSVMLSVVTAFVWKRVATRSPENLPTFYTAVSGTRLLLALGVMFAYYLVRGRDAMLVFFLVFMAFYVVMLIHHSVFFARVSNRS